MEDSFIGGRCFMAFEGAMGYLILGGPETGVCIRDVERMDGLFRIFGISNIEIFFFLNQMTLCRRDN